MRRSIRWRLQAWYGLVLVSVVVAFAGVLYYRVRAARFQEVDAALVAAAQYLDVHLRRFPPPELNDRLPARRPPPRDPFGEPPDWDHPGPPPRRPPPRPEDRDRLLAELTLPAWPERTAETDRADQLYFGIWRADGSALKTQGLPDGFTSADLPASFSPFQPRLTQWREYREATLLGPGTTRILVGKPVRKELADLRAFAWQLAVAGAAVLAVGLAGGWLVSARVLRPVAAMTTTASAISAANLSERIDPEAVDRELAGLARTLNAMFGRLEEAFERQARFTADASHELRTPLAIIRSHAELALSRPRTADEYRQAVESCLRASNRMTSLVEGLLTLARADAGKLDLQHEPVNLEELVEECTGLHRPLAEARQVTLTVRSATLYVAGDGVRLGQVVTNLLANAVQYNCPGGSIRVHLRAAGGQAVLSVADTGCGIPAEDRPHVFERFYRVDKARSRAAGGNGLGLAICKSIVEAHGGTIGFETEVGKGSTFTVRLPITLP